jgi:transposase-like protein
MHCKKCNSTNIVKNGQTPAGQQKYHCRACGIYTTTDDRARKRAAQMELVEKLYRQQVSQRGIARVTGVSRPTIVRWLRSKNLLPVSRERGRTTPPNPTNSSETPNE